MVKGACSAGNRCTCGNGWECQTCGRCLNGGCVPPCPEAVEQMKNKEFYRKLREKASAEAGAPRTSVEPLSHPSQSSSPKASSMGPHSLEEPSQHDLSRSPSFGPPEQRDPWESPPRSRAYPDTQRLQETHDSSEDPFYSFIFPCPGEGLGGTWEYCASRNLCNECQLCKVCRHCSPSCPEHINMPSKSSSMTPSVSIKFEECITKHI